MELADQNIELIENNGVYNNNLIAESQQYDRDIDYEH